VYLPQNTPRASKIATTAATLHGLVMQSERLAYRQPRRPQFVWIAEFLRLATGQINQPCLGFHRDGGLAASPRAIIKRVERAVAEGPMTAMTDTQREFPKSWFKCAKLSPSGRNCSLNHFGVDVLANRSQSGEAKD
jgi:hypothetical protein